MYILHYFTEDSAKLLNSHSDFHQLMLVFVYVLLLILFALLSICTIIRVRRDSVLRIMD